MNLFQAGSTQPVSTVAQVHLLEEEEEPEAIFDFEIGDSEVELFLLGSWDALIAFATGFMIRPDTGVTSLDFFPNLVMSLFNHGKSLDF